MPNMANCLTRNIQRFFEYDLYGLVPWDQVIITEPADGEGNAVEANFTLNGKRFYIRLDSSDLKPPLGLITMDDLERGPIDEATWTEMAMEIKSWHLALVHKRFRDVEKVLTHG